MTTTFKSYIPQAIKGINDGIDKGLTKNAITITAQAKGFAAVDKGEMKGSIMWKGHKSEGGLTQGRKLSENAKELEYLIGTGVEYALYQEVGTRFMNAQPFLRPAYDMIVNGASFMQAMLKATYYSVRAKLGRERMFK